MSALRVVKLSNKFLRPISLSVPSGKCLCLSGPSGVGKTVLLRAIADLDPSHGKVFLGNLEHMGVDGPTWRRNMGLLPAESHWWRERVGAHFADAQIVEVEQLGFDAKVLDRRIVGLSTGERQRLALLRLISQRPKALLLDEPTASLDAKNVRRVEKLIAAYRSKHKIPVLWVSHDPRQIKRVGDHHLRMTPHESR